MPNEIATADLVNQCVEGLIAEKGYKLSNEKHAKLHDVLAAQLMSQINTAILYSLPEDKFAEIEGLVADDAEVDPERLQAVVASTDIEMTGIVNRVIEKFREAFLEIELNEKAEA